MSDSDYMLRQKRENAEHEKNYEAWYASLTPAQKARVRRTSGLSKSARLDKAFVDKPRKIRKEDREEDSAESSPRSSGVVVPDIAGAIDTLADQLAENFDISIESARKIAAWHAKALESESISYKAFLFQRLIAGFASDDETRYILNGVCVEITHTGKVLLVATDGRRLGAIESLATVESGHKLGESVRFIVPKDLIKTVPRSLLNTKLTVEGSRLSVQPNGRGLSYSGEAIEGTYPAWRQVIPRGELTLAERYALNFDFLSGFVEASKLLEHNKRKDAGQVVLYWEKPADIKNQGAYVVRTQSQRLFGILMPLRPEVLTLKLPSWMSEPAPAAAAA